MMGVRITNTSRIPNISRELKELGRLAIEVGIFKGNQTADGADYAMIASVHEFGITIRKASGSIVIPERSFLRSTFDEKEREWFKFIEKNIPKLLDGRLTAHTLCERLGAKMVADVQKKIRDLKDPPNAEATIAAKGSSNPLIDTGGLRQRITYRVVRA